MPFNFRFALVVNLIELLYHVTWNMRMKKKERIARDTRLRRHELRELGVTKSCEKPESRKREPSARTFKKLNIYASRKHLS